MRTTSTTPCRLAVGLAAALLLTACGGTEDDTTDSGASVEDEVSGEDVSESDTADDEMSDEMSDDAATGDDEGATGDDEGATGDDEGATGDELLSITATAPDGSTFSLADVADRPVLVETFATWCSNCRQQLGDTQTAAAATEDAVFLALSVETALDPASLTAYAQDNGFDDIRFGVLDDAGLVVLQERFGGSVLNPPSTPKFRIDDGTVSELTTGFESAEEILASLGV